MNLRTLFSRENASKPDQRGRLAAVGSAFAEAISDATRELEGLSRRYEQGIARACVLSDSESFALEDPQTSEPQLRAVEQTVMRVRARMRQLQAEIAHLQELESELNAFSARMVAKPN